jgi:hypothetical protein
MILEKATIEKAPIPMIKKAVLANTLHLEVTRSVSMGTSGLNM